MWLYFNYSDSFHCDGRTGAVVDSALSREVCIETSTDHDYFICKVRAWKFSNNIIIFGTIVMNIDPCLYLHFNRYALFEDAYDPVVVLSSSHDKVRSGKTMAAVPSENRKSMISSRDGPGNALRGLL